MAMERGAKYTFDLIEDALSLLFSLGTALFITLPGLVILMHMVLIGLSGVGIILVYSRIGFLLSAPILADLSPVIAFVINAVLIFCQAAFRFIKALEPVIATIINGIGSLIPGDHLHLKVLPAKVDFSKLYTVSETAIHNWLYDVVEECTPYDEAWKVIYHAIKTSFHGTACATVRYVWPVEWIRDLANSVLWPFYDGSANPIYSHDLPGNCVNSLTNTQQVSVLCSALGSGYVVVEVLLPFMLVILFLIALRPAIYKLFVLAFHGVLRFAVWLSYKIGSPILKKIVLG